MYEQVGLQTEAAMDGVSRLTRRADVLLEAEQDELRASLAHLSALLADGRDIAADLRRGRGVIGQLLTSDNLG